jgi:WD40 repeat protein
MASLFISYSRKDIEDARRLTEAFKSQDLDFWIDWEGIPPTVDWWKEIQKGIEEADIFLFLLSPDSVRSRVCHQEIEQAARNGKRLIPVVLRDVKAEDCPAELLHLNWIFLRATDNFGGAFEKLITAIKTDYVWVQFHRRLQVKALEWERSNFERSLLLHGKDLQNAEAELTRNASKVPYPTNLQRDYVLNSRQASDRQRRMITIIAAAGVISLAVLALLAVIQARLARNAEATAVSNASIAETERSNAVNEANGRATAQANAEASQKLAEERANIALARQLVVQAQSITTKDYPNKLVAELLAIKSMQTSPSADAAEILQNNTSAHLYSNIMATEGTELIVAFSPNAKYFVAAECSEKNNADTCIKSIVDVWETTSGTKVLNLHFDRPISSVAISADNTYLALGLPYMVVYGENPSVLKLPENVYVLKIATGETIAKKYYQGGLTSIAISPNGRYLVVGGELNIEVLDIANDTEIAILSHVNSSGRIRLSPDGKYFAIQNRDNTINIIETASGKNISKMEFTGKLISFAFSPDSKYIATGGCNKSDESYPSACVEGSSHIFDIETGIEIAQFTNSSWAGTVAMSPNNKYAAFEIGEGFVVWDISTGKELSRISSAGGAGSLVFSPNGQLILVGGMQASFDDTVQVWDWSAKKETARITYPRSVLTVAFSSDGQYAMSAGCEKTNGLGACIQASAHSWQPESEKEVLRIDHGGTVWSVGYSADGKHIITGDCNEDTGSSCSKGTARIWETATGKEVARMTHNAWVNFIAISPDGKKIVSASSQSYDFTAIVWNAANGAEIARTTHAAPLTAVSISPDGKLVVSGSNDGVARVWEADSGRVLGNVKFGALVSSVAFDAVGKYVAAAGCDQKDNLNVCREGSARVWDASFSREIVRTDYAGSVLSVALSPDGKYMLAGGCDQITEDASCIKGIARLIEIKSRKEIMRASFDDQVDSVAFSADGKHVAASDTLVARVWETETGKEIAHMNLDNSGAFAMVSFSPDGKYLGTNIIGGIARLRIWEVATAKEISRITYDNWINSFAFSPDGKYIVIGSFDRTTRIWKWQPDDLIADACSRVTRNLTHLEWEQYIGDALAYQPICPALPVEPEPTVTPNSSP